MNELVRKLRDLAEEWDAQESPNPIIASTYTLASQELLALLDREAPQ